MLKLFPKMISFYLRYSLELSSILDFTSVLIIQRFLLSEHQTFRFSLSHVGNIFSIHDSSILNNSRISRSSGYLFAVSDTPNLRDINSLLEIHFFFRYFRISQNRIPPTYFPGHLNIDVVKLRVFSLSILLILQPSLPF